MSLPKRAYSRRPLVLPKTPLVQPRPQLRQPGELHPIFESYIRLQHRRGATQLTIKTFTYGFRRFQTWMDTRGIDAAQITLGECEEYFAQLITQAANGTARQQLAYVRAAYRYAVRHDVIGYDPTGDVKLPWPPDREPATYSNDDLRRIHAAIRTDREELAFHLFAFAGLRLSEATSLTWDRIDLDQAQMKFNGKGGKFRLVPLHSALQQLLHEHAPRQRGGADHVLVKYTGGGMNPNVLGRGIRELVNRAHVEIDSPTHAFRRTVATVMYEQGVRTRVIERIMGWAPRLMHERHYLRVADKPMREAINILYADNPVSPRQTSAAPREARQRIDLSLEIALLEELERRLDVTG